MRRLWSLMVSDGMLEPDDALYIVGSLAHACRVYSRCCFWQRHLYHSSTQLAARSNRATTMRRTIPIFVMVRRSFPRSSTNEVSIWSQKLRVSCSGTGSVDASKLRPWNVLLISAFKSSKGVSTLWNERVSASCRETMENRTHKSSITFLSWSIDGSEAFSLINASVKSLGRVTFRNGVRSGRVIWGAVREPKGSILLAALTTALMAELAVDTALSIASASPLNVDVMKLLI